MAERIQLAGNIWDTITEDADALPLTDAQREELDRQLVDQRESPEIGRPWSEMKARLLGSE